MAPSNGSKFQRARGDQCSPIFSLPSSHWQSPWPLGSSGSRLLLSPQFATRGACVSSQFVRELMRSLEKPLEPVTTVWKRSRGRLGEYTRLSSPTMSPWQSPHPTHQQISGEVLSGPRSSVSAGYRRPEVSARSDDDVMRMRTRRDPRPPLPQVS